MKPINYEIDYDDYDSNIIKSNCTCFCCSKSSYYKSLNKKDLFRPNGSIKRYQYEFKCKKLIKIKKFNFILFKFFIRLFADITAFTKRESKNSKQKFLKLFLITLIILMLFLCCFYVQVTFFYVNIMTNKVQQKLSYDLMRHALQDQNITRHQVACTLKDLYQRDYRKNFMKKRDPSDKYKLFNKFYLNTNLNQSILFKSLIISNTTLSTVDPQIYYLFKNFKFCLINKQNKYFLSKSVYKDQIYNYKRLLYRDKLLPSQFKKLEIDERLQKGGLYKPDLCIQEYIYNLASSEEFDLFNFINLNDLEQLSLFSFNLFKSHHEYSLSKQKIIENYIRIKQNSIHVIIIPYLKREDNLIDLLSNLHGFLQRQFLNYRIFLAEQINQDEAFNKGRLYNTAFEFIMKNYGSLVKCMILHDVDLIPESDYNIYECDDDYYNYVYDGYDDKLLLDDWLLTPRHLSFSIRHDSNLDMRNKKNINDVYVKSPYELLVGGVLCIRPRVFQLINGFSNDYWNWGAEDDDFAMRMIAKDVCVKRPDPSNALYKMSNHTASTRNPVRESLLFTSVKRMNNDGLSNLKQLNATVIKQTEYALYTHLAINVGKRDADYFNRFNLSNSLDHIFRQIKEISKN
ncbi:unnamed protein product [Brachionus calyciflorus]|uniref:Uncharacterized protein n=1 Tax=Brachionus calyciflorus TaxID=104777 RepID=A0A813MX76_9BILA|nr:unnamed protein product [Brachionus calyciflorus]